MIGLYRLSTGALFSVGSTAPDPLPPDSAVSPLPENGVPFRTHDWQEAPPAWVTHVEPPVYVMPRGDWMARLGFTRETALNMLRLNPASDLQTRATLATLESALLRRSEVDVRHLETQAGAAILSDVLIAIGQLQAEEHDSFIAMMLAPVVAS